MIKQHKTIRSFQGKVVNHRFYTDQEYVDAMKYKDQGSVSCSDFCERYGFWEYVFTYKAERHAAEVNKCINDIKREEARENAEREKKLRAIEAEKQKLAKEIEELEQKEEKRQQTIEKYTNIEKNTALCDCCLSSDNKNLLLDELFIPYAESIADKTEYPNIPNGILIYSPNSIQNDKAVKAIASQLQQEKFSSNFKQINFDGDIEKFQNDLLEVKAIANQKYSHKKEITVIYIPDFDKIALKTDKNNYTAELNSFLKVYMLDCAKNGCIIASTAKNENNIESPFLINNKRFGVIINLEDED